MKLTITKNKDGSSNFYVQKSFRDANGKATTKTVEKLGSSNELSKLHEDPEAWAREYVKELNRLEKESKGEVSVRFHQDELLTPDEQHLFDGGYLFLQKIYHELRLDYICSQISARHDFNYSINKILQTLLYGRILFPYSKLGTFEYAPKLLEKQEFKLHDVYRALSVLAEESDFIQSQVYKFSKDLGKRNDKILYYDCTNYYFEIEHESGMRKYGVSKENRPNPIVEMGLFMDGDGIPLAFCLHSGNTNEQKTMIPLEEQIIRDFGHAQFITCTDSGLSSNANKVFNDKNGRCFVTTQSVKKMKKEQKEWALDPEGWKLCGSVGKDALKVYNISTILENEELYKQFYNSVFYKEQWFKEDKLEQKYLVTFSLKQLAYQRTIRNEQIERARKAISSAKGLEHFRQTDYKRFITKLSTTKEGELAEKKTYMLNEEAICEEEKYDGIYAVATDLEDKPEDIIAIFQRRWEIEECFRIMKTEFSARPVYLSRDDRIRSHFLTCFLSLIIYRYLEKRLGNRYTCQQIIHGLQDIRFLKIPSDGYIPTYTRTQFTDDLHAAFGFRTDRQIITKGNMRKIIAQTKLR